MTDQSETTALVDAADMEVRRIENLFRVHRSKYRGDNRVLVGTDQGDNQYAWECRKPWLIQIPPRNTYLRRSGAAVGRAIASGASR
jgi:hypothetical protein